MKKGYLALIITVVTLLIYGASCTTKGPTTSTTDYASLIVNLQDAGATIEQQGEVIQPFFSVSGQSIKVNGEDIQVFEYQSDAGAESEAALVSPDGSSIGTSIPFWIGPPHFYKSGKIIVLYIGENKAVTDLLQELLGSQFAGQ
jgi:hypothetical protein